MNASEMTSERTGRAVAREEDTPNPGSSYGVESIEMIGRFRILEQIGIGGIGVVFRALDTETNREVALKVPRPDRGAADPAKCANFLEEAVAARAVKHENVVTVLEHGEDGGRPYIVMERLEGEDLKAKLARRGPLGVTEALRVVLQIAKGLAHAHDRGIVHGDIKPANVFICTSGVVKILDFGLASTPESARNDSGGAFGTPSYMSPEQVLGDPRDHRSDVFSLGSLFFELLTGRKPFGTDATRLLDLVRSILKDEPPAVDAVRPFVPRVISEIVRKALAKSPAARYQHMKELARDIECFLASPAGRSYRARVAMEGARETLRGGLGARTQRCRRTVPVPRPIAA